MSAALVPGRILRVSPPSGVLRSASSGDDLPRLGRPGEVEFGKAFMVGDLRPIWPPIWTSGIGGGLGRRGEEVGDRVRVVSILLSGNMTSHKENNNVFLIHNNKTISDIKYHIGASAKRYDR